MSDEKEPRQTEYGLASLPRKWAVVVQLVGTFGLAVFLVLYYVLVMYPAENRRYEELEASVRSLMQAVEGRLTLLEGEQADRLEELFVVAVTSDFCIRLVNASERGAPLAEAKQSVEDALMRNADLLRGLTREDGRQVSEMLVNKIRVSDLPERAYARVAEWGEMSATDMLDECRGFVDQSLRRLRRAK